MNFVDKHPYFIAFLMACISGSTFLITRQLGATLNIEEILGLRFGLAFLVLMCFFYKSLKSNLKLWGISSVLGTFIFWGCEFLGWGLQLVHSSRGAIITSASVLTVFLGEFILRRMWPRFLLICMYGCVFISLFLATHTWRFDFENGDFYLFIGSICFGLYSLYISRISPIHDRLKLSIWQCFFVSLWSFILCLIHFDQLHPVLLSEWIGIVWLAIAATVFRYSLQLFVQQKITSGEWSLIFVLEPIVALILGALFESTRLTVLQWCGVLLLLISSQWARILFQKQVATASAQKF